MHRDIYTYQPLNTAVFRPGWTHSYSAAMALGTFVLVCPQGPDSERALALLDGACDMFIATQENRKELKARQSLVCSHYLAKKFMYRWMNHSMLC